MSLITSKQEEKDSQKSIKKLMKELADLEDGD